MRHLFIALLWCVAMGAWAQIHSIEEARGIFDQANEAYLAGDYEDALALYRELSEQAPNDAVLLFNRGNAHLRLGERGWAIWCYERALKMAPGWQEARHNLRLARGADAATGSILARPLLWARDSVAPQTWSWVAAWAWALALVALSGALLTPRGPGRTTLRRLTALGTVIMVLSLVTLHIQHSVREASPPSIVVAPSAAVRSGPGPDAGSTMGELPGGSRVWQIGTPSSAGWVKVRTESGQLGFVDQETLQEL